MKNIAIIPARSGSKGLKDKNIKQLAGIPLLGYSIKAARESGKYDAIHVSTDSEEYAAIARELGADVPFLRSEELSSDTATTRDAMLYVLEEYEKLGKCFDTLTILQPTSPLRSSEDIDNAFKLFGEKEANAVVSVCEVDHSPLWSNTLDESLDMSSFLKKEAINTPRQKLSTYYRLNGAIYLSKTSYYREQVNLYEEGCFALIMPKERSVDIDDKYDFAFAEVLLKGL